MTVPARALTAGEEESLTAIALEVIPAGVVVFDAAGRVLYRSAPLERLLGGVVRDLGEDGAGIVEKQPWYEILTVLREAVGAARPVSRLVTFERECRHYIYISTTPSQGGKGERRTVAFVMDLTEVARQGDMVAERVRQLRHDLRGPLTSIHGAVDLMLTERVGRLEGRQRRLLEIMVKATESMAAMVSGESDSGAPPEGQG